MLDNNVIELAHRQIKLRCEQQQTQLTHDVRYITAEMNKRGVLHSSAYILAIQSAYAQATTEREFVWEILLRCISTVGITYDENLEEQLKTAIDSHFPENMNGLKYSVQEAATRIGMPDIITKLPDAVGEARQLVLRKIHSEIELFILKLKTNPVEQSYSSQINIHNSNIGALQTGNGSIANVSQKIDTKSIEAINNALINLATELDRVKSLPHDSKPEIVELVHEGIDEISKEKPNLSKIKSFISTIGNAVSFTADLKPAYEALKAASALIGLSLP